MKEHLSPQQIDEAVAGQTTAAVDQHLRACRVCARAVQRIAEPLHMFGSALRSFGEESGALPSFTTRLWAADRSRTPGRGAMGRWHIGRVALGAATLLMVIAVPVYRSEEMKRKAAFTAMQDEILLRRVESGLARSVPAPMEPLANLMSNDLSR